MFDFNNRARISIVYDYVTRKGNAHRKETTLFAPETVGACAAFGLLNGLNAATKGNRFVLVSVSRNA